jgi:glycosyltransferase involved in cell wall biosynthesis
MSDAQSEHDRQELPSEQERQPKAAAAAGRPRRAETVEIVSEPDVTVLYPCLNEEQAIGDCVRSAREVLETAGLRGEVLVVDNDSTDRSAEIARESGARVVLEKRRGYGSAYLRGFKEARGKYVVMLDADGTYPVQMIPQFVAAMRDEGAEMVIGNRFAGQMARQAMPLLNRYVGNPVLSGMTRLLYRVGLKDIHCGMRGIRREVIPRLMLQTPGMEFATEMIVKALDHGLKFVQLGIPYAPRVGPSKLHPLRDAWRHVEYMLVFSPVTLFLLPGALLYLVGLGIQLLLLTGPKALFFHTWDVHTNLAGLATSMTGMTLIVLGTVSCAQAWSVKMRFRHSAVARWVARQGDRWIRTIGIAFFLVGFFMWASIIVIWWRSNFGELAAMSYLALATMLLASGLEMIGAAFLVHVISLRD